MPETSKYYVRVLSLSGAEVHRTNSNHTRASAWRMAAACEMHWGYPVQCQVIKVISVKDRAPKSYLCRRG